MRASAFAEESLRPIPSDHTLRAALDRIHIACDRVMRAASSAAAVAVSPEPFALVARRRAAYLERARELAIPARAPSRGRPGTSTFAHIVVRRWLDARTSARAAYQRLVRFLGRAITACTEALAMTLPPSVSTIVASERCALIDDQRLVAQLVRASPVGPAASSRSARISALRDAGSVALGTAAASVWLVSAAIVVRLRD